MPTEDELRDRLQLATYAIWLSLDSSKVIKRLERWIFNKDTLDLKIYSFDFDLYNSIQILIWKINQIMSIKA